jgi:hypothetical protein
MGTFLEEFMGSIGGDVTSQISGNLGIDQNIVKQVLPQVVPMILGGLKKQKDEHGGQERVDHILNKYGSPDALNNLNDLFSSKANEQNPDPNLGGLLGNAGNQAVNMLSNQFKLDSGTVSKLIPMIAPVVLGFLTTKRDSGGAGSSGISTLLDQDGDGSILDDVAGFLMGGSGKSGQSGMSNLIGNLLGGLFGKKR